AACAGGLFLLWGWLQPEPRPVSSDLLPLAEAGVRLPATVPAASAGLPESAEVVGITVGGRCRAYLLAAFVPLHPGRGYSRRHVVNDLLGETPVTVTSCDRTGCVKAFTGPAQSEPLDVGVGGFTTRDGRQSMVLLVGGSRYRQDTTQALEDEAAPFPYHEAAIVRPTWGEWRQAHPETDVYLGEGPPGGSALP